MKNKLYTSCNNKSSCVNYIAVYYLPLSLGKMSKMLPVTQWGRVRDSFTVFFTSNLVGEIILYENFYLTFLLKLAEILILKYASSAN